MKKLISILILACFFFIGFLIGKMHVLNDSIIYTDENYVYIIIDENIYMHEIF